mmetsp:Transcript_56163/g.164081  ORF Transcript_56163/g.164081 Transcript_56163/m.164081 type:complete len:217 (-) Transcript_56163:353-1003(-)
MGSPITCASSFSMRSESLLTTSAMAPISVWIACWGSSMESCSTEPESMFTALARTVTSARSSCTARASPSRPWASDANACNSCSCCCWTNSNCCCCSRSACNTSAISLFSSCSSSTLERSSPSTDGPAAPLPAPAASSCCCIACSCCCWAPMAQSASATCRFSACSCCSCPSSARRLAAVPSLPVPVSLEWNCCWMACSWPCCSATPWKAACNCWS